MKKTLLKSVFMAGALALAANASANPRVAVMIPAGNVDDIDNFQEYASAKWFTEANADGVVIAKGETSKIDASKLDCIWLHIDRCNVGMGNLPAEYSDAATIDALKKFVADGGSLLLTKQATQLLSKLGRIDASFNPGIYGDGDGNPGTDIWTLNAQIGYMNIEADPTQYYDRRSHAIYKDLEVSNTFAHESFPMEGTGDGSAMHREDHNCMWDLNAYSYTAEGKNTVEKFEKQNNAVVLGTWGHVVDYAVAGVVEFLPQAEGNGTIIANGLAACEWAPRSGVNAFHNNLTKLTDNCINYLAAASSAGIEAVAEAETADAPAEYFNLQGIRVANPEAGQLYIVRQGNKVSKVIR